jgi:hypothetical protein
MPLAVSDSLSNTNEQIEQAAKAIGRSAVNRRVFEAIYGSKQRIKTVKDLAKVTKLDRKRVLTAGKRFAGRGIVRQIPGSHGNTAYEKIDFFHAHKQRILACAGNAKKLAALPTKRKVVVSTPAFVSIPTRLAKTEVITVDDVDSFSRVRKVIADGDLPKTVSEKTFKLGIRRILAERSNANDWGGEKNDIYTSRLVLAGKRRPAAFALKGPGKTGKLVPGKMGKNGDQIQRLFQSTAEVFFVQYWSEIDESVIDQMKPLAVAKSLADGSKVWFGVIDGNDSHRLYSAYPKCFRSRKTTRQ